jgi:hypothetical protein
MLTNEEISIIMRSMKRFARRAQRNMRRIDEARQVCEVCHTRRREFTWSHVESGKCGWHNLCHCCFLKIVDKTCPFCRKDLTFVRRR